MQMTIALLLHVRMAEPAPMDKVDSAVVALENGGETDAKVGISILDFLPFSFSSVAGSFETDKV